MEKRAFLAFVTVLLFTPLWLYSQAAGAAAQPNVIIIPHSTGEGYDLWVKASPSIKSVMLTDTPADPQKKKTTYALRAFENNDAYIGEKRLLNGEPIAAKKGFFLIDSTVENASVFNGQPAFHLYVPSAVRYGYAWSKGGERALLVKYKTFLNLRLFSKPYGDYSGSWKDFPFQVPVPDTLPVSGLSLPPKEAVPMPALPSAGLKTKALLESSDDTVALIDDYLKRLPDGSNIDLALVLDSTQSMQPHLDRLNTLLVSHVFDELKRFNKARIAIVLYRDYKDQYVTWPFPFTTDLNVVTQTMKKHFIAVGGGDLPEAVYEGIYTAIEKLGWEAHNRVIFQMGDAPAHSYPLGSRYPSAGFPDLTKDNINTFAIDKNITVVPILLQKATLPPTEKAELMDSKDTALLQESAKEDDEVAPIEATAPSSK